MSDEDKNEEVINKNVTDDVSAVEKNVNKDKTLIQKQQLGKAITTLSTMNLIGIVLSIIIMPFYFFGYMMVEGFSLFMNAFGADTLTGDFLSEFLLLTFLPFCMLIISHFLCIKSLNKLEEDLSKAGVFNYCALVLHIIGIGLYALVLKSSEICTVYLIVDAIIWLICFIITAKNTKSKLEDYSDIISINKYWFIESQRNNRPVSSEQYINKIRLVIDRFCGTSIIIYIIVLILVTVKHQITAILFA